MAIQFATIDAMFASARSTARRSSNVYHGATVGGVKVETLVKHGALIPATLEWGYTEGEDATDFEVETLVKSSYLEVPHGEVWLIRKVYTAYTFEARMTTARFDKLIREGKLPYEWRDSGEYRIEREGEGFWVK